MRIRHAISWALAALLLVGTAGAAVQVQKPLDFEMSLSNGRNVKLSDLRGQTVLLVFFRESCAPCKDEVPYFNKLAQQYPGRLTVIGAGNFSDPKELIRVAREWDIQYPVFVDYGRKAAGILRVYHLPNNVIVNQYGYVIDQVVGYGPENVVHHAEFQVRRMGSEGWPPKVKCRSLTDQSGPARAENIGGKVSMQLHDGLKAKGILVDEQTPESDLIIDGSATKSGQEVGVDIYIRSRNMMPMVHITERVSGEDYSKLIDLVYRQIAGLYEK
jgi:peroxiredoxin